ncbi:MAG: type II toxin-antitoxin system RelE/ParE family toxin [Bacteroidota bacterium]|nr:type II toxin-antitoxin system RelE/ParE family toxin [Bacteroidota bacterium]
MKRHYELELREEAEEDIAASVIWYRVNHPSRVERFLEALEACFSFIEQHPTTPTVVEDGIRQFPLRSFPFFVVYTIVDRTILIIRVFHMSRDERSKLQK